jgi:hypothetical protein
MEAILHELNSSAKSFDSVLCWASGSGMGDVSLLSDQTDLATLYLPSRYPNPLALARRVRTNQSAALGSTSEEALYN